MRHAPLAAGDHGPPVVVHRVPADRGFDSAVGRVRVALDQRVIAIRRTAATAEGRVIEVNEIAMPAHQWELSYEWPAG